jgi:hypothetical protein
MPLHAVAAVSLAVAVDYGFNACVAEVAFDAETYATWLILMFGSHDTLSSFPPGHPSRWAMVRDDSAPCYRSPVSFDLPYQPTLEGTYHTLQEAVHQKLLGLLDKRGLYTTLRLAE